MERINYESNQLQYELKKLGYEYDLLDSKIQSYLQKINISANEIINKEKEIHNSMSRNYVSIKNISKLTNISRQTFYNQPILAEYVEFKSKEHKKIDSSLELANLRKENEELKKEISLLHKRDVELMEIKRENETLKKELVDKKQIIKYSLRKN